MSERKFIDPMTSSFREERALIELGRDLLSWNNQGANGVLFRLGVVTYVKALTLGRLIPDSLKQRCDQVLSNDRDYLSSLLESRLESDRSAALQMAYDAPVEVSLEPCSHKGINWSAIPEEKKLKTYIQTLMEEDFRAFWISKYNSSDEDDKFDILTKFADDIICRHQADLNKPFKITDKNEIRKVLRVWADSARGV